MKHMLFASLLCVLVQACSNTNVKELDAQELDMRLQKIEFDISCINALAVFTYPNITHSSVAPFIARGAVVSAQQGNDYARNWINNNITNQEIADMVFYSYAISPLSSEGEIKLALEQVDGLINRVNNNERPSYRDLNEIIAAIYARNGHYDKAREYQLKNIESKHPQSSASKNVLKVYESNQPFISNSW